jgi:hypothetical protein
MDIRFSFLSQSHVLLGISFEVGDGFKLETDIDKLSYFRMGILNIGLIFASIEITFDIGKSEPLNDKNNDMGGLIDKLKSFKENQEAK